MTVTLVQRQTANWIALSAVAALLVCLLQPRPFTVNLERLAFGHLFGFVGVLIAGPVNAVLVVAVRRLCRAYTESNSYLG